MKQIAKLPHSAGRSNSDNVQIKSTDDAAMTLAEKQEMEAYEMSDQDTENSSTLNTGGSYRAMCK